MKVGYVYDPIYLQHDTGYHSENTARLTATLNYLEKTGTLAEMKLIKPRAATVDEIAAVHDREYISYTAYVAKKGGAWVEVDTVMSSGSYDAAVYAAGGTICAVDEVMQEKSAVPTLWSGRRDITLPTTGRWAFASLIILLSPPSMP